LAGFGQGVYDKNHCLGCRFCRKGVLPRGDEKLQRRLFDNQLTYVTRLMQYEHMMDGDLDDILAQESAASDLLHDYEISVGAHDEDSVKTLDNRYYAFVHWLKASLRSIGCDEETVEHEATKFRDVVDQAVAECDKAHGNPAAVSASL
jgi:hypothetical protein